MKIAQLTSLITIIQFGTMAVAAVVPQTDKVFFEIVWNDADLDGYRSCDDRSDVIITVNGPPSIAGTSFTLKVHRGYGPVIASADGLAMPFFLTDTTQIPCGPYERGQFYRFSIEYQRGGEKISKFDNSILVIWSAGSFRFQDSSSTQELRRQVRGGFRARQVQAFLDWERFVGPEQFRFVLHDPVGGKPGRNTYYFCSGNIPCGGQFQPVWLPHRPHALINVIKDVENDRTFWISYHEAGHGIAKKLGLPFWADVGHVDFHPSELEAILLCERHR